MANRELSLSIERNRAVRDALVFRGKIPVERLDALLAAADREARPIGDCLRESGLLLRPELATELRAALSWEVGADVPGLSSLGEAGPAARAGRDPAPILVTPDPFDLSALDDLT